MERVIFILSYEKRWDCWLVYPYRALDAGDFFQSTGRYAGEEVGSIPLVKEINRVVLKYDTPALYKQFGRKKFKDEREFLLKADEAYIREYIRPYIEKYVSQVLDRLAEGGFPLFLRNSRLDNFYKEQRIFLQPVPLRALLRFERTGEFTRYILRLTDGIRTFYPSDYEMKILTRHPCRVICGRQLFCFPGDFDGQRLQPFLGKREIMIPKANEQLYFKKFILKNIRHEEIEVQGFEVIIREVEKKARLSLEREVFGRPVLVLECCYGAQCIPVWSKRKALVELHTENDSYSFYKINRDLPWEEEQQRLLLSWGLELHSAGCFRLKGGAWPELPGREKEQAEEEQQGQVAWLAMIEWYKAHRQELTDAGIGFTQKALRNPCYVGEWRMENALSESPDWFELKTEVVLSDGRRIPLIRFREHILTGKREFLLDDGTVFFIPEEWFATYGDMLLFADSKEGALFFRKNQYILLGEKGLVVDNPLVSEVSCGPVELPRDLRANLRSYQQRGYEWLYRLYTKGLGGCLADDMGLGKTLQVITLMLKYRQEATKRSTPCYSAEKYGQLTLFDSFTEKRAEVKEEKEYHTCLVVVPASLVHNWRSELRKFAPYLTLTVYAGQNRRELQPFLQSSDVVLVTYHTLRNDIDYLSRLIFGIVVADEAQMLKNPGSQLHQAMLRIRGNSFFALSGTPIENSLTDLWAVMNLVNRGLLGSHHFFRANFIRPVLAEPQGKRSAILQKLIEPFILRRTKEEVLADLPELTTEMVICEPEEEQRKVYEEEQARVRNYILEKQDKAEGLRSDFMVLKALIRLRQIANHPVLVDAGYEGNSGKFREIFRMLEEVVTTGHKVLVFSSFVKYLRMVASEATKRKWNYAMLTGLTADREAEVRRFMSGPDCRLFLISLKAGGVGLNLTEADYVFILDPWWNQAAESQAVGRAHRIGQKHAVFVYRFITAGTLEEKILAIQQRKQCLAEVIINPAPALPLSNAELLEALG